MKTWSCETWCRPECFDCVGDDPGRFRLERFAACVDAIYIACQHAVRCRATVILPKPLRLSPVYFALNPCFFHCILPTMHFCVMSFAETSAPFSIVFCPRCNLFHYILPGMHFFVMYFAATSTPFSILFGPESVF